MDKLRHQEEEKAATMAKSVRLVTIVAINVVLVLSLLMVVELGLYVLMSRSAPTGIRVFDRLAQKIYWSRVHYIQYDPNCSQYDPGLSYRLNPGICIFANDGFSTRIEVNSAGLRDDEASLSAPEIIVTGDSQAMGWGVEGDDTFAQLIQDATGKLTLNAAVSSYGTAREMIMLQRLDLSALQTLVVQYSDNDGWENNAYLAAGRNLPIQSAESYAENVAENSPSRYFPGAYLRAAFRVVADRLAPSETDEPALSTELTAGLTIADKFLRVLAGAELRGARVHLVIMEINTHGRGDGGFIDAVSRSPELDSLKGVFATVSIINTRDFLVPEDRLFPDGHMTASGHRKIANAILRALAGAAATPVIEGTSQ